MTSPRDADVRRLRAQAAQAYRAACRVDPGVAPHADVVFQSEGALGQGGMGVVYRVLDRRLDRPAALKVAREGASADALARFEREARITARLDHPGVPPVYEAGTTPSGRRYLLMRLIEGEPLSAAIRGGAVGRRALLEALIKVADAVAYAHEQGVVHRDLKPANVMIGAFGEVLVLDWGLARRSGEERAGDAALTQEGETMGTPGYMAPEQAGGDPSGPAADVFALGAILTEVLTGRSPVGGTSPLNKVAATVHGRIARPRDLDRGAPRELDALAAAALAVDPAARPSAAELAEELRRYQAGEPLRCYRYGPRERLLRAARRRAGAVAGAAAVALATAALGGAAALALDAERRRADAERREAEAARREARADAERQEARAEQARAEGERRAAAERAAAAERVADEVSASLEVAFAADRAVRLGGEPGELARLEAARGEWGAALAGYVRGAVSPAELLATAKRVREVSGERLCEAYGLLGVAAERRGERDAARELYASCVAFGQRDFVEHRVAEQRLEALGER